MFRTIGHTFSLMKMSWRVLMQDRELILFPIMAGIGVAILVGVLAAVAAATGTFDRLETATSGTAAAGEEVQAIDVILGIAVYTMAYFIVIFFNAALISAALERLRGGDPNVGSGPSHALKHIHTILAWALIAATVGLLLQMARSRSGTFGRIALSIVGGVWAYVTFFVIPVLVTEGIGPIEAVKRSGGLFKKTWGQQFTASFGFGLVYIVAVLIAFLPAALLFALSPILGIIVGVFTVSIAVGTVQALEGIFKAALYEFANGETPLGFERSTLSSAYRAM